MKTKITQQEQSITLSDIQQIENQFNFKMPENLKKLYLKYNGGILDIGEDSYDLDSIKYGNSRMEESIDSFQITEEYIPREYLPFATTPVGHIICINTGNSNNNGKIYLFRYDEMNPVLYNASLEDFLAIRSIDEL